MNCDGESASPNDQEEEDWMDTNWSNPDMSTLYQSVEDNVEKSSIKSMKKSCSKAPLLSRMLLNDNKAGMEGIDKEKINKIIFEASKGSKYFENEKKKEAQLNERIEEQRKKEKSISELELRQAAIEADKLLEELERCRNLSRFIVHIDMDAFYAAVEMRDDPTLRDKPIAVGSNSMLSTSNYLARKFGVRAAMPGFIGKKLCPELIIVKANFKQYTAVSKQVREIMAHYDPNFCPMSLDEAYLDFTNHLEKRKTMSVRERTVLCRTCDSADAAVCLCDLNFRTNDEDDGFKNNLSQSQETEACINSGCGQINTGLKNNLSQLKKKDVCVREATLNSSGVQTNGSFETNLSNLEKCKVSCIGEITLNSEGVKPDSDVQRTKITLETSQDARNSSMDVCQLCGKPYPPSEGKVFDRSIDGAVGEMRCRIEQRTRLTASAGIACNVMLAKVCSDKNKPNGQYRIEATRDSVMNFVKELPIRKICGIGKISEKMLNAVGVVTCQDLYHKRAVLSLLYSQMSFNYFMRICLGMGSTVVDRDGERKSMSTERTFSEISKTADQYSKCKELCQSLSDDLKEAELKGRTVTLKLKTVKFEVKTRAVSLPEHTSDLHDIYTASRELLKTEIQNTAPQKLRLRLMGVRMSNLVHQNLCQTVKQDTISGMFKKMASKTADHRDHREEARSSRSLPVDSRDQTVTGSSSLSDGWEENDSCALEKKQTLQEYGCTSSSVLTNHMTNKSIQAECLPMKTPVDDAGQSQCETDNCDSHIVKTSPHKRLFKKRCATSVNEVTTGVNCDDLSAILEDNQLIGSLSDTSQIGAVKSDCVKSNLKDVNKSAGNSLHSMSDSSDFCVAEYQDRENKSLHSSGIGSKKSVVKNSKKGKIKRIKQAEGKVHENNSDGPGAHTKEKKFVIPTNTNLLEQQEKYDCPVCGETVVCKNLNYFNDHVDICLFKQITQSSNRFDASGQREMDDASHSPSTASVSSGYESGVMEGRCNVKDETSESSNLKLGMMVRKSDSSGYKCGIMDGTSKIVEDTSGSSSVSSDLQDSIVTGGSISTDITSPDLGNTLHRTTRNDNHTVSNATVSSEASDGDFKPNKKVATVKMGSAVELNSGIERRDRLGKSGEMLSGCHIEDDRNSKYEDKVSSSYVPESNVKQNHGGECEKRLNISSTVPVKQNHGGECEKRLDISSTMSVKQNHGGGYDNKLHIRSTACENDVGQNNGGGYEAMLDISSTVSVKHKHGGAGECRLNVGSTVCESDGSQFPACDVSDADAFYVCPVCNAEKQGWSISAFNDHVDSCLSRTTIKEILKEQEKNHKKTKRHSSEGQSQSLAKKGRRCTSKNTCNIKTFFTS